LIATGGGERKFQRVGDVGSFHRRAELPGDDVARVIIQHGREIIPAPTDDLEISEVRLPHLVDDCRFILEFIGGFDDNEGWAGNQIMGFQQPIYRCFRDKIAFLIGKAHGQFPGR